MTKFTFGLLGLSMLIAAPAMASAPAMKAVKNADTLTKEVNLQTYAKPSKKAGVKKIGSAADLEGAYTWYGISQLSTNGGKTVSMSVSMTPGDVASEVYFSISARPEIELKGVVDVANSTFTINRQTMGFNTNYNTNEYFYIGQLVQEGEGHKLQEVRMAGSGSQATTTLRLRITSSTILTSGLMHARLHLRRHGLSMPSQIPV